MPIPKCSSAPTLADEGNAVCSRETYTGGALCCNQILASVAPFFVIDTDVYCADANCTNLPVERFFLRATIRYEDVAQSMRSLNRAPRSGNHLAPNIECTAMVNEYVVLSARMERRPPSVSTCTSASGPSC